MEGRAPRLLAAMKSWYNPRLQHETCAQLLGVGTEPHCMHAIRVHRHTSCGRANKLRR
jgi:hypothetical protein